MNNSRQISQIRAIVISIVFALITIASPAYAMTREQTGVATDNKINVHSIYIRPEKKDSKPKTIKRLYSRNGSVTINHKAGIVSGGTELCVSEGVNFGYDPSFTFVAGNGAWDTPYGKWVSSINQNRTGEAYSSHYWQKIDDPSSGNRWGKIAWSAVKPVVWSGSGSSSGKVYMTSSNNTIVSCAGMRCVAKKNGTVTVTANFPPVTARMWAYIVFSDMDPDWISEHFSSPNSVNKRFPNAMFCPTVRTPSNDNVNYCTNRLVLPAKTVSWTVTIGAAARCDYCGDGEVTSPEACDTSWSGNTWPVDNCTPAYESLCTYCVSPGRPGECTLVQKPGPGCGDGIINGPPGVEDCDNGPHNGLLCGAPYDGTCQYCSHSCKFATETGPYCGDGNIDGPEVCDEGTENGKSFCDTNCEITSSCGTLDGTTSNSRPTTADDLCGPHSLLVGSITMNANYQWEWQCQHQPLAPVICTANNCLTGDPSFQIQSPVYFGSKTNVSVYCNGVPGFCCELGSPHDPLQICDGGSNQIGPIDETSRSFFVECEYPGEPPRRYDVNLQTMCMAKACNVQGTCQATPVAANLPNDAQCKSSCNSDADCSSGRMIETKP